MKLSRVKGVEGLIGTFVLDGKELSILFTPEMLRDLIRQTYREFGDDQPAKSDRPTLELVHSGIAQPEGTVDSQLVLDTVQAGRIVLSADDQGLRFLREAVDAILNLRGGHGTVQ